jgi:hypothetical protein
MNASNIKHALYGIAIQLIVAAVIWPFAVRFQFNPVIGLWLGSSASTGAFIMREYTQREVEICQERRIAPEQLTLVDGFTGWKYYRFMDAAAPAMACGLIALAAAF